MVDLDAIEVSPIKLPQAQKDLTRFVTKASRTGGLRALRQSVKNFKAITSSQDKWDILIQRAEGKKAVSSTEDIKRKIKRLKELRAWKKKKTSVPGSSRKAYKKKKSK